jgi:transcription elongation factor SPT5
MYTENGGIFVCKTRHLRLAGGNKTAVPNTMTPTGVFGFMSPQIQSPMHPSGGRGRGGFNNRGFGGRGGRGGGGVSRDREILGKTIKITGGPYKGAVGIIKDATESTARVELHSSCQTISVDRNHIAVVGAPSKDGSISSFRTPNRTPGYGSATPQYIGSKTPLHGSQTPQYDIGNRTPFGGMTPAHDGSMTPRHETSAWNPAVSNTPARPNDFSEFSLDEPSPSPGYNPSTPGGGFQSTFAPHTPGGLYSPSPSAYQVNYTPSPGYSPQTIGPASPMNNPQTPGGGLGLGVNDSHGEWCSTDLEVRIRSADDSNLRGQTGFIRTVNNGACSVFLPDEDRVITVPSNQLEPVQPQVQDHFKLIAGEDREATGLLLSIRGNECTILINDEKKFMPLSYLCKMQKT